MKKNLVKTLVVATVAGSALVATAAPAAASASGRYLTDGTRIRSCSYLSCSVVGLGYKSQTLTANCYINLGSEVGGTGRWISHKNNATGVSGWSHVSNVTWGSPGIPHCGFEPV
ncbi:hypothetical protein [Longispora albida]|uniref:hypothetical protein n=1 Tax=Longispora albida TaxID=203523 RepID=UPI00035EBF34|nr:hypothetical protein [Longispora albida]